MGAAIRFFDKRFIGDRKLELLELELDRKFAETKRLQDALINIVNPPEKEEEEPEEFPKPLGQVNWRVRARQLEEQKRNERIELDKQRTAKIAMGVPATISTEELESELLRAEES